MEKGMFLAVFVNKRTKEGEREREREWMGGRAEGWMNDGESVYCGKPTEREGAVPGANAICPLAPPLYLTQLEVI